MATEGPVLVGSLSEIGGSGPDYLFLFFFRACVSWRSSPIRLTRQRQTDQSPGLAHLNQLSSTFHLVIKTPQRESASQVYTQIQTQTETQSQTRTGSDPTERLDLGPLPGLGAGRQMHRAGQAGRKIFRYVTSHGHAAGALLFSRARLSWTAHTYMYIYTMR